MLDVKQALKAARSLQVGAPADRAMYIHRLGRTARAGKSGQGARAPEPRRRKGVLVLS